MAGNSTNRFGGNALLIGGVLWTIALVMHPDVSTLAGATAASGLVWKLIHWAYLLGDVLLIAGVVMLSRTVEGGANGGWGAVALAGGVTGFALDAATTGMHMFAFPPVLAANTPNLQAIFDTTTTVNAGIGGGAWFVNCVGLVALGLAVRKEAWAGAAAIVAMVVGALQLCLVVFTGITGNDLIPAGIMLLIANALLPLAYAYAGFAFSKASAG